MRIGLICPYNYFRPGGVQNLVRDLADELEGRGHYVRIIVPRPRQHPEKLPKNLIMVGGSTEFKTPFATKGDLGMSASNEKIDQMLEAENFDVLHFHEPGVPVLGIQLLSRSKTANVATRHATLPDGLVTKSIEKLMQPIAKYIVAKSHVITAVSEVAKKGTQIYDSSAEIEIVPNGINIKDFDLAAKKTKVIPETIVYVGRLEKRKGVKFLVDAFGQLQKTHPDIKLIIAGDGNLMDSLQERIEKYEIKNVSFLGFISEVKKAQLMASAAVFCSPALFGESFGIVLLEAMAAGAVVVAGNNPGYASVMTGRGRLSLVSPESTDDFAQRLEIMLYDEDVRKLFLEWSRKHTKDYEFGKIVDQYEAVYNKAIANFNKQNTEKYSESN